MLNVTSKFINKSKIDQSMGDLYRVVDIADPFPITHNIVWLQFSTLSSFSKGCEHLQQLHFKPPEGLVNDGDEEVDQAIYLRHLPDPLIRFYTWEWDHRFSASSAGIVVRI